MNRELMSQDNNETPLLCPLLSSEQKLLLNMVLLFPGYTLGILKLIISMRRLIRYKTTAREIIGT